MVMIKVEVKKICLSLHLRLCFSAKSHLWEKPKYNEIDHNLTYTE